MRSFEDWSNSDINKAIEKITGMYCVDCEGKYMPTFDYCNNWADMGPLIDEADICLEFAHPIVKACTAYRMEFVEPDTFGRSFYHMDKSPLRAAAIVFLMMNGVKP